MNRSMTNHAQHPAQRFVAPRAIERGVPLARLIGRKSIELLAESMVPVAPAFDVDRFVRAATRGLSKLALMQRGQHVARALAAELPRDFDAAAQLLVASLGPELQVTEGVGLAPFFYLPHSQFLSQHAAGHVERGTWACYELTKRFTAEFCIRPLIVAAQDQTLDVLAGWVSNANPHVRRLVSEGTRPRLPWGIRLPALQRDPRPTLALLEKLKDDQALYVRRSVANHLADIWKDNPDLAYATCQRWTDEARALGHRDAASAEARRWIVRHALRLPAKKGLKRALQLRQRASAIKTP